MANLKVKLKRTDEAKETNRVVIDLDGIEWRIESSKFESGLTITKVDIENGDDEISIMCGVKNQFRVK